MFQKTFRFPLTKWKNLSFFLLPRVASSLLPFFPFSSYDRREKVVTRQEIREKTENWKCGMSLWGKSVNNFLSFLSLNSLPYLLKNGTSHRKIWQVTFMYFHEFVWIPWKESSLKMLGDAPAQYSPLNTVSRQFKRAFLDERNCLTLPVWLVKGNEMKLALLLLTQRRKNRMQMENDWTENAWGGLGWFEGESVRRISRRKFKLMREKKRNGNLRSPWSSMVNFVGFWVTWCWMLLSLFIIPTDLCTSSIRPSQKAADLALL